ncbi:MAG: phosphatidate cytidylyltransferase [Anaerovoracaceae bacterium]
MKTRVISGLVMIPLLAVVYFGGYWLIGAAFLIGLVGIREFFNGFRAMDIHPSDQIAYVGLFALYAINFIWPGQTEYYMVWFAAVIVASSLYMFKINERKIEDAMATMLGTIYVAFFSFHIVLVDQTEEYSILIWLVIITAFCTDIMAYFSGYLLGKHKLCPTLSPKKTIEGAIGGTMGSIVFAGLFGYFIVPRLLVHCLIIGFIGSIISQCGDLTASAYKRKMGIKDYGDLIPGHGGIMDRFDSVLFTAPLVYYYIVLVLM